MGNTIINLTSHPITIVNDVGEIIRVIEPSGQVARLVQRTERTTTIDGIPISRTVYGEPENLPAPQEEVYYIVSQLIKNAMKERNDLLVPAEMLRDESGKIIGCQSLGI